jgi:hypothetical protein
MFLKTSKPTLCEETIEVGDMVRIIADNDGLTGQLSSVGRIGIVETIEISQYLGEEQRGVKRAYVAFSSDKNIGGIQRIGAYVTCEQVEFVGKNNRHELSPFGMLIAAGNKPQLKVE